MSITVEQIAALLRERVNYTLEIYPEEDDPEGFFASDEPDADARMVAEIRERVSRGDTWAWCTVIVKANFRGVYGRDSLGACSYANEDDFCRPGDGYYSDMRHEALMDLARLLHADGVRLEELGVDVRAR
jgi:hypothetical protein